MEQVLLVVQVLLAVALIIMVLLQRSDSDGFGLGGGGGNFISGRTAANLMTRTTAIIAALFIINSLALSVLAARGHKSSIVDTITEQQGAEPSVPAVPLPGADKAADKNAKKVEEKVAAPTVPVAGDEKKAPAAEKPVEAEPVVKKAKKVVKPVETETETNTDSNQE